MGYTIRIGNVVTDRLDDYSREEQEEMRAALNERVTPFGIPGPLDIAHFEQPDAPAFPGDETTGRSNERRPSYTAWAEFAGATGLTTLFFDRDTGLMREHPGTAWLTPAHLAQIRQARMARERAHPYAMPGYSDAGDLDYDLARLGWLEWWVEWALTHCERPGFQNS